VLVAEAAQIGGYLDAAGPVAADAGCGEERRTLNSGGPQGGGYVGVAAVRQRQPAAVRCGYRHATDEFNVGVHQGLPDRASGSGGGGGNGFRRSGDQQQAEAAGEADGECQGKFDAPRPGPHDGNPNVGGKFGFQAVQPIEEPTDWFHRDAVGRLHGGAGG
jgi:hypothetical protein